MIHPLATSLASILAKMAQSDVIIINRSEANNTLKVIAGLTTPISRHLGPNSVIPWTTVALSSLTAVSVSFTPAISQDYRNYIDNTRPPALRLDAAAQPV